MRAFSFSAFFGSQPGNLLKAERSSENGGVGGGRIVLRLERTMEYDRDKVDEMVLALLWLTAFDEDQFGARTWKSHDWDALDRLHAKGYISDPMIRAKRNRWC